ncbi:MAG TPA: GAF domain-containing protein [Anaerolineales bacterium]|nr:GAF domain-containing protein [Anaerolineales bacterium]
MDPLALTLIVLGIALLSAVAWSTRTLARTRRSRGGATGANNLLAAVNVGGGTLVVQGGGRLEAIDADARELFGLDAGAVDLQALVDRCTPAEALLEVLARPGVARIQVAERHLALTSIAIPGATNVQRLLLTVRDAGRLPTTDPDHQAASAAALALAGAAIAAAPDLEAAHMAVVTQTSQLLGASSVALWLDAAGGRLQCVATHGPDSFSSAQCEALAKAAFENRSLQHGAGAESRRSAAPVQIGDINLGALTIALPGAGSVHSDDLLLGWAAQVAALLHHARQADIERRHAGELAELAEIAREIAGALEDADDPRQLLGRLTERIARWLDVELAGLLMFDVAAGTLVAQAPFFGVPDIVLENYRIRLAPGTPAEALWRTRDHVLSRNVRADLPAEWLELRGLAETAGVRTTLLTPLSVGGRRVGALQVANRRDGGPFDRRDAERLSTIARQASAMLENTRLVREAQARAHQAERLAELASALAAETSIAGVAETAIHLAQRLLSFDIGAVLLIDDARGDLLPQPDSVIGLAPNAHALLQLNPRAETACGRGESLHFERALLRAGATGPYSALIIDQQLESLASVPLLAGERALGEILVAAHSERAFAHDELQLLTIIAAQIASALERARLVAATDQDLQRRVEQLTALTHVSRELSGSLERERILRLVHAEAVRATRADRATITLLTDEATAAGLSPDRTLEREALATAHPARSLDARTLAVPILVEGRPGGVIWLETSRVDGFDASAEDILTALAAQTATAIVNARRFEDEARRSAVMQQRAEQLSHLLDISRSVRADTALTSNLQAIATGLHESVGYRQVSVYVRDASSQHGQRLASVGVEGPQRLRPGPAGQPWYRLERLMREAYRVSASYFLPAEHAADLTQAFTGGPTSPLLAPPDGDARTWRSGDLLVVPMVGAGSQNAAAEPSTDDPEPAGRTLLGVITLAAPADGRRPDISLIEVAEIFANQAALAIENARLVEAAQRRATQLTALAEATGQINTTLRTGDVAEAMVEHLAGVVPFDSATLWLRDGDDLRVAAARGFDRSPAGDSAEPQAATEVAPAEDANAERIGLRVALADSALFSEMARTGAAIVVRDVMLDPRFPAGVFGATHSWLGVPLVSKSRVIGALALDKIEPNFYAQDVVGLVTAFANQAATALDNARLFEENEQRRIEIDARSQRLALLNRISSQLSRTLDLYALYDTLVREVSAALDAPQLALFTFEGEGGGPVLAAHQPATSFPPAPLAAAFARARETLSPVAIEDIDATGLLEPYREALHRRGTRSALVLPLVASGVPVGMLQIEEARTRRRYTPGEIELAQTLANQAAVALQNARLLVEVQTRAVELGERNERMTFLNRMANSLSATLDLDLILRQAAGQLVEIFTADHASLMLFDDNRRVGLIEAEHPYFGAVGQRLNVTQDVVAGEILQRRTLAIEDIETDLRLSSEFRANLTRCGARSGLVAPLVSQGLVVGLFTVESRTLREFTSDELELSETVAAQIAAALTNAQFASDLETRVNQRTKEVLRERERVETLLQITTELASSLELDRVLHRALHLVTEAVNAAQGSIFLLQQDTGKLIYRAALGSPKVLPLGGEEIPFRTGEGLVGWVIKNRQPVIIHNLDVDERWKKIVGQNVEHRSALAVPIQWNDEILGALLVYSPSVNAFDDDHLRLVAAASNQVGSAINNAELYRLIRDQAERLGVLLREQQVETTKNRAILEGIGDGVLVADAAGRVTLLNDAAEQIFGLERELVLGKPVGALNSLFTPEGRSWIEAAARAGLNSEGPRIFTQIELIDKRLVTISLAHVVDGDEFIGTVSLIRDVTRDVEIEHIKSEFVTNVSHELRTPITPIKGYVDMLLLGAAGPMSDQQKKLLGVVKSNAERLHTLVNDLLEISRLESGRLKFDLRPVSAADILAVLTDQLRGRSQSEGKPMTISAEVAARLPAVLADRNRLTQVLANLADNAFSYTPAGGSIAFRAWVDEATHEVRIDVVDTGVGFSAEHQKRLFERFLRAENPLVMAKAGTGLGLSISRQLIEAQGGRLWLAQSVEGEGSVFSLTLPLAEAGELAIV